MPEHVTVSEHVSMEESARELGLTPMQLDLAVQLGEIRTVGGEGEGMREVPREELDRLSAASGFPQSLRLRLRVVGPAKGAELLGVVPSRFTRLARGGCFSPVRFYVNRYGAVVWLYLTAELTAFAERRPELLRGVAPRGLRVLLDEGMDFRPRQWRERRVGQLSRQAPGPWERAAVRAAVLDEAALEEAVPDAAERARLRAARPELVTVRAESFVTRRALDRLRLADADDEVLLHRLLLDAELEQARGAADTAAAPAPVHLPPGSQQLADGAIVPVPATFALSRPTPPPMAAPAPGAVAVGEWREAAACPRPRVPGRWRGWLRRGPSVPGPALSARPS